MGVKRTQVSPTNCIDGAWRPGDTDDGRSMRYEKAKDVQIGGRGSRVRYLCSSAFHTAHVAGAEDVFRRNAVPALPDMPSRRVVSTERAFCSYGFSCVGCRKTSGLLRCARPIVKR